MHKFNIKSYEKIMRHSHSIKFKLLKISFRLIDKHTLSIKNIKIFKYAESALLFEVKKTVITEFDLDN